MKVFDLDLRKSFFVGGVYMVLGSPLWLFLDYV
jgi:hypothetical protein